MALRVHVDIVSAESLVYSGQAERVVIPARAGEICVLARHAPLLTNLKPGLIRLMTAAKVTSEFFVSSGYVEIQPHVITVLADTVLRSEEFDAAAARAARYLETAVQEKRHNLDSELALSIALLRIMDDLRQPHPKK
jgi:F-type H+-transporting ATPase subunit epsilon